MDLAPIFQELYDTPGFDSSSGRVCLLVFPQNTNVYPERNSGSRTIMATEKYRYMGTTLELILAEATSENVSSTVAYGAQDNNTVDIVGSGTLRKQART